MFPIILATFVISRTAIGMCAAGIIVVLLGLWSVKTDVVKARGLEKIVALVYLCFAIPLAVFSALHLFAPQFILPIVPPYMPWRMFWVYFIGCALIAASLSIATKVDYATGAALLVGGVSILLNRKTRIVSTYLGGWILLLVLVIYGPVLISALSVPGTGVQVEAINYFADTLLFAGVILSVATASP